MKTNIYSIKSMPKKFWHFSLSALLFGAIAYGVAQGVTSFVGTETSNAASGQWSGGGVTYDWQTLKVGAGGFMIGISASNDGQLVLAATDVYGGYRLAGGVNGSSWEQVVTATSMPAGDVNPENSHGVYSFAVSPSNNQRAYMYFSDNVYKTTDGALTWQPTTLLNKPASANDDTYKDNDKEMAVHPTNPDILLVGVPNEGLYRTTDGGQTFSLIGSIPSGGSAGINGLSWDPALVDCVYGAVQGDGMYRSCDSGATWSRATGGPSDIHDIDVANDGTVVVAEGVGNLSAWKYVHPTWTDVSAATNGWYSASIAIDAANSNNIYILSQSGDIIYSNNGGTSWTSTNDVKNRVATDVPWLAWANENYMTAGELMMDPTTNDRLWFTQGIGMWKTTPSTDVSGSGVTWTSVNDGIEELVANDIIAPPGINRRTMASWDRPLFSSSDSDVYPSTYGPNADFNNAWDVDWSASNPSWQAALISDRIPARGPLNPSYSTDGGVSWTSFPTTPLGTNDGFVWGLGGSLAVGAPGNVVIIPAYCDDTCDGAAPYYTTDGGTTWNTTTGLPSDTDLYSWYYLRRRNLAADRVTAGTFYAYHTTNGIYRSTDSGANWSSMGSGPVTANGGYNMTLKAVPGQAGHLFLSAGHQSGATVGDGEPFYRSTDGGATWTQVTAGLEQVYSFGFGKEDTGQSYPAIYIAGWLNDVYGIYRSVDNAASWQQVGDYPADWMDWPSSLDADKDIFGCVYLGSGGSGFMQGCPAASGSNQTPTDLTASTPTIQENNATDTHISPITTTDPDNGDTHTYSLTCDTPGADDSRFQISATAGHIGHLHSNYVFDYETPADTGGTPGDNVYEVCVRTTDDGSPAEHYDKNVDITVTNDTGDDPDTTPPVITLIGANPQTILQNGSYVELGATANDNIDGDITGSIVIDASAVDTNTVGQYSVTYDVADAASNDAVQMVRTVDIIASDTTPPVITLTGANPQTITQGNSYVELGATATDNVDGDVTGSIVIDASAVDTNTLGQYVVTYDVSDAASNDAVQVTRTVDVTVASDTTPPVITLTGANPQTILQNGSYVELGATANDNVDGDISGSIVINASAVDTNTIGQYSVTYDVQDAAANDAVQMVRTVDVTAAADTTPPVITLLGANPLEIVQGATYTDPGATATDNVDGTLTSSIVVGGDTVDVNTIASYNVTYNVSDAASNDAAQQTRVVTVVAGGSGGPDPDGVDKAVEDAAPNSGDANGDGFQDSTQDNVASAPNPNNTIAKDAYVSLEASNGSDTNVTSFGFIFEPTSTPDATHDYPLGLFDFSLSVPNGATRTVTLYLDQAYDTSDWVWRKYNTTDNTYTDVPGVTYSTTTIGSNTVTTVSYALTDGGTNDEDGVANGTIVDPAGPAVLGGGLAATGDEIVRLSLMGALVIGTALLSLVAVRGRGIGYKR